MWRAFTIDDVRNELRRVTWNYGFQGHWARANGLDPGYVSAVINGYRRPNDQLLEIIGFRERTIYERIDSPAQPDTFLNQEERSEVRAIRRRESAAQ